MRPRLFAVLFAVAGLIGFTWMFFAPASTTVLAQGQPPVQ